MEPTAHIEDNADEPTWAGFTQVEPPPMRVEASPPRPAPGSVPEGYACELAASRTAPEAARALLKAASAVLKWDSAFVDTVNVTGDRARPAVRFDSMDGGEPRETAPSTLESGLGTVARCLRMDGGPILFTREDTPPPGAAGAAPAGRPRALAPAPDPFERPLTTFGDTTRRSRTLAFLAIRHSAAPGRLLGVASVQSYTARAFGAPEIDALQRLVDCSAGAFARIADAGAATPSGILPAGPGGPGGPYDGDALMMSLFKATDLLMGVVEVRDDDEIVHVSANDAVARMLGIPVSELPRRPVTLLGSNRDDLREIARSARNAALDGRSMRFDTVFGEELGPERRRLLRLAVHPVAGPAGPGRSPRMAYVGEDITERRRTETALRDSEARFKAFMDNTPAVAFLKDEDGRYVYGNAVMQRLYPDLMGHTDPDWAPADLVDNMARTDRLVRETGQCVEDVVSIPSDRGPALSWLTFKFPVRDPVGRKFIGGVALDVTASRRAEERLLESNRSLEESLKRLGERNREMKLLNDMGDQLQSCLTTAEARQVLRTSLRSLFMGCGGTLCLLDEQGHEAEPVAAWGGLSAPGTRHAESGPAESGSDKSAPDKSATGRLRAMAFGRDDCWALRRGRLHRVEPGEAVLPCRHLAGTGHDGAPSVCIPMSARGETLGVLTLRSENPDARVDEAKVQIGITVAEQVTLALANLRLRDTLRDQSIRDPLTDLFNRRHLEVTLAQELSRAVRHARPLGLLMLDLDHFKTVNDRHGHDAGDALLKAIAELIRNSAREEDVPCRYGGEEFVIVLPETDIEGATARAEGVRRAIAALKVHHRGHELPRVTASVGVAAFPAAGACPDELVKAADQALYRAKAAGRDRVVAA